MPKSKVLGCMVIACLVLKETGKLFQGAYIILHFHQQCMSDSVSPLHRQHLVLSSFFTLAILLGSFGDNSQ